MTEFFKRTETHFRFTREALVSNRLANPVAIQWLLPCTTWFYDNIYTTTRIMM